MTPLEAAAKFLGEPYYVHVNGSCMMISFQGTPLEILGTQQVTPSELLVALLKRSAELGHFTQLEWGQFPDTGWMWIADIKHQQGTGQTPLDAVLAAVQALQERTNE